MYGGVAPERPSLDFWVESGEVAGSSMSLHGRGWSRPKNAGGTGGAVGSACIGLEGEPKSGPRVACLPESKNRELGASLAAPNREGRGF